MSLCLQKLGYVDLLLQLQFLWNLSRDHIFPRKIQHPDWNVLKVWNTPSCLRFSKMTKNVSNLINKFVMLITCWHDNILDILGYMNVLLKLIYLSLSLKKNVTIRKKRNYICGLHCICVGQWCSKSKSHASPPHGRFCLDRPIVPFPTPHIS